jgi:predicted nucleic acid-binding protein
VTRPAPIVCLDLNVLVAALLDQVSRRPSAGPPRQIVQGVWNARYRLVMDDTMLDRLGNVLARPHLRIPSDARANVLAALTLLREPAPPHLLPPPPAALTSDPEDDAVLWCALAHGAEWLVTGNTRHLTALTPLAAQMVQDARLRVATPREFLAGVPG